MNSWHYQSDGWLSPASAAVYEASTETLFLGRQDAMQRAGLALLLQHLRQKRAGADSVAAADDDDGEEGDSAPPLRILDVGAGTGRFMTFVRDNLPSADVTCLDLSPFYLAEAREGHAHWEALRGGAVTGRRTGSASFVQAAAEALPLDDASFDAVTCVYLMHELPPAARTAVASELARVLRPGGVCVLTDSVQLGDRPAMDARLGRFGDFNEVRRQLARCHRLLVRLTTPHTPPKTRSPTTGRTSRRTWARSCAPPGWRRRARRSRPRPRLFRSSSLRRDVWSA
jgi:SAM-dependent methyltransferase